MDVWRGEERRESMVNEEGKISTLHDEVVRLVTRVDLFTKALIVILPVLITYEVWNYQRVSRIDSAIDLANARGTVFLVEKVQRHHTQRGCHFAQRHGD